MTENVRTRGFRSSFRCLKETTMSLACESGSTGGARPFGFAGARAAEVAFRSNGPVCSPNSYPALRRGSSWIVGGSGKGAELHEVDPREQVGARTGEAFDFQYHQAAADALEVLDDSKVACVYCEWHDDYVIETAGVASYKFHQVKTRKASKGPWSLNEFFGIGRAPAKQPKVGPRILPSANTDSILGRMLAHVRMFGDRCGWFVFVTDTGVASDFDELLSAARNAAAWQDISGDAAETFGRLYWPIALAFAPLAAEYFLAFLKRLYVREAVGKLTDLKACKDLIGGRILDLSEVNLHVSEARKIASDLVFAVRERSHRVVPLPTTAADLRGAKGLVLDDVLRILSLSSAGYRELREGGRATVVALSRLHRLCKEGGISEQLIPDFCRLKASWDAWWAAQRHGVNHVDQLALRAECAAALRVHSDGKLDFTGLSEEAKSLASKYERILTSTDPLTPDLVFGLMMALAAEAAL